MRIITDHVFPPIPERSMDWCAFFDGQEEKTRWQGWGPTEAAAIADLHERLAGYDEVFCGRCGEIVPFGADEGCRDPSCAAGAGP